ncbi:adenosylcobinamide amidohydrolase [uncultured Veillonella sp.]|uniref:adenosylcobinamide amidohydrolase n=1 Tax=uncultured Veillonella sp. TaxID=159268 RepID=UPI002598FA3C|nr:adenosylcobinamide amidohydrolase [uncultured Veillonella sp.]
MQTNPYTAPAELITGGRVTTTINSITVDFDTIHYAICTGPLHGGLHHVIAVRNQQLAFFVETEKELPGGSAANYLAAEFEQVDLPVNFCSGLLTSASMEKHAYAKVEQGSVIVEVIATAGFEATAHRAGDGYLYEEADGSFHSPGTINLLIFTNKALTDGAMVRALITVTEAKAAALADAGKTSVVSHNIATGTATDGVILTIDTGGEILTDAGTFSLFGDTLAKAVRLALARCVENVK